MLPPEEAVAWAERLRSRPSRTLTPSAERLTSEIFMKALIPHLADRIQEEWLASAFPRSGCSAASPSDP